jgi:hypothetical protein
MKNFGVLYLINIENVLFRFFFLGATAAINFIMSVCPFARLSAWNVAATGQIFMKFDI